MISPGPYLTLECFAPFSLPCPVIRVSGRAALMGPWHSSQGQLHTGMLSVSQEAVIYFGHCNKKDYHILDYVHNLQLLGISLLPYSVLFMDKKDLLQTSLFEIGTQQKIHGLRHMLYFYTFQHRA